MRGYNQITVLGNLVSDPKSFDSQSGCIARIRVACSLTEEKKLFIDVVAFDGKFGGKLATNLIAHKKKGDAVLVIGRLEDSSYEKEGKMVSAFQVVASEIRYLDKAPASGPGDKPATPRAPATVASVDDELPF